MAERLRRELGIEVDAVHGALGEYKVLVDGELVVDGGTKAKFGLFPSAKKIVEDVRARLAL